VNGVASSDVSLLVGNDCTFGLDEFQNPRICSESETIKNVMLFILFAKPGQYPSLPYLGMDIRGMLFAHYDEINETELEERLIAQCSALSPYFQAGDIQLRKMKYRNMPSLIIHVSTSSQDHYVGTQVATGGTKREREFYIGISVNELAELLYSVNSQYVG